MTVPCDPCPNDPIQSILFSISVSLSRTDIATGVLAVVLAVSAVPIGAVFAGGRVVNGLLSLISFLVRVPSFSRIYAYPITLIV